MRVLVPALIRRKQRTLAAARQRRRRRGKRAREYTAQYSDIDRELAHPRVGASWEGFVIEQVLRILQPSESYFWATHQGAEVDLLLMHEGRRFGIEVKYSETPKVTRSARSALADLRLIPPRASSSVTSFLGSYLGTLETTAVVPFLPQAARMVGRKQG